MTAQDAFLTQCMEDANRKRKQHRRGIYVKESHKINCKRSLTMLWNINPSAKSTLQSSISVYLSNCHKERCNQLATYSTVPPLIKDWILKQIEDGVSSDTILDKWYRPEEHREANAPPSKPPGWHADMWKITERMVKNMIQKLRRESMLHPEDRKATEMLLKLQGEGRDSCEMPPHATSDNASCILYWQHQVKYDSAFRDSGQRLKYPEHLFRNANVNTQRAVCQRVVLQNPLYLTHVSEEATVNPSWLLFRVLPCGNLWKSTLSDLCVWTPRALSINIVGLCMPLLLLPIMAPVCFIDHLRFLLNYLTYYAATPVAFLVTSWENHRPLEKCLEVLEKANSSAFRPKTFMIDKSDSEIMAISNYYGSRFSKEKQTAANDDKVRIQLCFFHFMQAWERYFMSLSVKRLIINIRVQGGPEALRTRCQWTRETNYTLCFATCENPQRWKNLLSERMLLKDGHGISDAQISGSIIEGSGEVANGAGRKRGGGSSPRVYFAQKPTIS